MNELHLSAGIIHNAESNRRPGLHAKHLLKTQQLDLWASFSDHQLREYEQYALCISNTALIWLQFTSEVTAGADLIPEGLNSMPVVPY